MAPIKLTCLLVTLVLASGGCTAKMVDGDEDGVGVDADCDDGDPALGDRSEDEDCDGVDVAVDCDDNDEAVGSMLEDLDCDLVPHADDCDDEDAALGDRSLDADCDGVTVDEDCDDNDFDARSNVNDKDCDTVDVDVDCDDDDPSAGSDVDDNDCDGIASADDCNDQDASIGPRSGDPNCDGKQAIRSVSPANGQTRVDIDDQVVIVFDEAFDPDSLAGSVRWGPVGYVGSVNHRQWEDGMGGSVELDDDRTLRITPPNGRFQEFETGYWIEVAGVTNLNGDPMATFRSTFTTVTLDSDYAYRFRNHDNGGALDTWPGDPTEAYLFQPFDGDVYTGSIWHITDLDDGAVAMNNVWLGTSWLLDAAAGNRAAYMYPSSSANDYRTWLFVAPEANVPEAWGESPRRYRMRSRATGELQLGAYSSKGGKTQLGMVGAATSGRRWIPYNYGLK